jgi:O-antigen/teichoic acid export membrane protein
MNNIDLHTSRQIKGGVVIGYLSVAFNIIAGLIYTPWMVRQIGQADYGLLALAVSFISFVALDFGLGSAVTRFLCQYKARGDKEGAKKLLGLVYKLFLAISILVFMVLLITFIFIDNIYVKLTPEEIEKFKIVFAVAGIFSVFSVFFKPLDGILEANERFIFSKNMHLLHKVSVVLLMVFALLLGYGIYALVIVHAFVGIIIIGIKLFYIKKSTDAEIDFSGADRTLLKEIFQFSFWMAVVMVIGRLIINITPSLLGIFAGSAQIAVFAIGMAIEGYTHSLAGAFGNMFLPKVTRMTVADKDMSGITNLMIKVGRIELLILSLIVIGFSSMGYEFMQLWMGKDFTNSYYVVLLLIIPLMISLTQNIGVKAIIALNKVKYSAMEAFTNAVICIAISVVLSRRYGAVGAAAGIFVGRIAGIIIKNFVYQNLIGINITRFFRECHLKMIVPLLLALGFGIFMQRTFPVENMFSFMVKALIFGIVYFMLMWVLAMNAFEKDLFAGILKKAYNVIGKR